MKERLDNLVNNLKARGVVDVKFYMDYKGQKLSDMVKETCEVLEAIEEGRYTEAKPLGDSVRLRNCS